MKASRNYSSGLAILSVTLIIVAAMWLNLAQAASGAGTSLALDGSGFNGEQHQYTPLTVSLRSSNPDDIVLLLVEAAGNSSGCYSVTSVSDTAGLTWYTRGGQTCFYYSAYNTHYSVDEFWTYSTNVLKSDTINATISSYSSNGAMFAYAIHGANTAAPFDSSAGLPNSSTLGFAKVSTKNSGDLILGINYEPDPYSNYGAGSGFIGVVSDTDVNWASEYIITTSAQSGLVLTYSAPSAATVLAEADAICAAGESNCVGPMGLAPTTGTSSTTSSSSSCVVETNYISCSTLNSKSSSTPSQTGATSTLSSASRSSTPQTSESSTANSSPSGPTNQLNVYLPTAVAVITVAGATAAVIVRIRQSREETKQV